MKKIILLFSLFTVLMISCEKDELYVDCGVYPYNHQDVTTTSLYGTTWVLTKFVKGFMTESPMDTVIFLTKTYILNGIESDYYTYSLYSTMEIGNPVNLTMLGFSPFGDNGAWSATITRTFIEEGEINVCEFENIYGSKNSSVVKANFSKIN